MNAGYRERALKAFPARSNGEFGIPATLLPVLQRGKGWRVWDMGTKLYLSLTHDAKAIEKFVDHFADALAATRNIRKDLESIISMGDLSRPNLQ